MAKHQKSMKVWVLAMAALWIITGLFVPGPAAADDGQEFTCFFVSSSEEDVVCGGCGSDCLADDMCRCFDGAFGSVCQKAGTTTCSGVANNDPATCSGNGICTSQDSCKCLPGFLGNNCQV